MQDIKQSLKQYFGFDSFRGSQEQIISDVMTGKDVMVIMPTGGGKSLCYQLPAIALDRLVVVVSPLIALMKDQVDNLKANGIRAYAINSVSVTENRETLEKAQLIYVSPEYLSSNFDFVASLNPAIFAIDEAHCISSWGHDFREEYKNLNIIREKLPNVPIIALTATADNAIQNDISKSLNIPNAKLYKSSFDRPNIFLEVRPGVDKLKQIVKLVKEHSGEQGIIYCLSRNSTESLAESLVKNGIKAKAYHAGLESSERSKIQNEFFAEDIQVIVATVAFGMGIDKSNVRYVIHYNIPKNIESYYQEIGRAGRDGLPALAVLFFSMADVIMYKKFIQGTENEQTLNEKLNRMYEYSNASFCRRKMLLGYFHEYGMEKCNNCDICLNPPTYIDGTILAQKVLSAIAKVNESLGMNSIINILRGSREKSIVEKGYDKLSVHGICQDLSYDEMKQYVNQLVNQGLIYIDYTQFSVLKLTTVSHEILFHKKKVELTIPKSEAQIVESRRRAMRPQKPKFNSWLDYDEDLLANLKSLRNQIARDDNVPPYVIFTDIALTQMAQILPTNTENFLKINGVGAVKCDKYSTKFLEIINKFISEKNIVETNKFPDIKDSIEIRKPKKVKSYLLTLELFNQGISIPQIAEKRLISMTTVYDHLSDAMINGYNVDIEKFVDKDEIEEIKKCISTIGSSEKLVPIYQALGEQIACHKIRFVIASMQSVSKPK